MIHDGIIALQAERAATEDRRGPRVPFPSELLVTWFSNMATSVRYRIVDAGEGGFRIRTSTALFEGMTGVAHKYLPDGKTIDRTIVVTWTRPAETGENDHEAGLRLL